MTSENLDKSSGCYTVKQEVYHGSSLDSFWSSFLNPSFSTCINYYSLNAEGHRLFQEAQSITEASIALSTNLS